MIKLFNERNPLIFFPKKWANSVTKWLLGVYSPTGTIKIANTANPDEHGSLALDVNIDAIASKIEKRIESKNFTAEERLQVRDVVRAYLDGMSVIWKDRRITVNDTWLEEKILATIGGNESGEDVLFDSHIDNDYSDESDGYIEGSTPWAWSPGANGLKMDVYCEVISAEDGTHGLQRATLTFSPSGKLIAVEKQEGVQIHYCLRRKNMNQINAYVDLNVTRLHAPLKTWYARVGHNFVARLRNVPDDVTKVFVRVFKSNNAYFDISAKEHRDGDYSVRVPAGCFGFVGEYQYEIHATASDDQPCALGVGRLVVGGFSTTTNPEKPGEVQTVAEIPCEGGGYVQVVMKWDGYAWVQEAVYNAATTTEE